MYIILDSKYALITWGMKRAAYMHVTFSELGQQAALFMVVAGISITYLV